MNEPQPVRDTRRGPESSWFLLASGLALYALLHWHARPLPNANITIPIWLAAIAFFLLCCWQLDREDENLRPFTLGWRRRDGWMLAGILLLALVLRTFGLDHIPLAMHNDEAAMAMEGVHATEGSLQDPFAFGWYSHPAFWFFLVSFSQRLFGETLAGVRILSAVIGTLAIATTYLMARLLFGVRMAWIAVVLLATYHFHIHFSRIALNNGVDATLGPLLISCLALAIRTRRAFFWGLSGVILGLALYFYMGTRLFIVLVVILGGIWLCTARTQWRQLRAADLWSPVLLLVAGFLFVGAPLLQSIYKAPQDFLSRTAVVTISPVWIAQITQARGWHWAQFFWDQLQNAVLIFYTHPDVSDFYDRQRPLLEPLAAILLTIGVLLACMRLKEWRYQVLVIWIGLAFGLGGVLMVKPGMVQRYVTLAPVVCLLIALAIDAGITQVGLRWPRQKRRVQVASLLLVSYLAITSIYQYFGDYIARETFGAQSSQAATLLGRYLQTQPVGTQVWFLGNGRISYQGFPILAYYARQVNGQDLPDPLQSDKLALRISSTLNPTLFNPRVLNLYVAVPERATELELVQATFPGGVSTVLVWPKHGQPLLYLYAVAPITTDGR